MLFSNAMCFCIPYLIAKIVYSTYCPIDLPYLSIILCNSQLNKDVTKDDMYRDNQLHGGT